MTDAELTLRDYFEVLRRHRLVVVASVVVLLVAALGYSLLSSPTYESRAGVLLRTSTNQQLFPSVGISQFTNFIREPASEVEFIETMAFSAIAEPATPSGVTVRAEHDTSNNVLDRSAVIEFVARSSDPALAERGANAWATTYLEVRSEGERTAVDAALANLEVQIEALEQEKAEILEPLEPINQALLDATDPDVIARLTTQRLALQDSMEDDLLPVTLQLRTLSTDLSNLRIEAGSLAIPEISARLATEASPARQVAPNTTRNLALAGVLGVLLGVGGALLLDSLRTAISSRDDLEMVVGRVPILAEIPDHDSEPSPGRSAAYHAEIERVVSSVVQQVSRAKQGYRLLVTSPGSSDGKTTLAYEIGWRLGLGRIQTVLIDADLRRPTLHTHLGLSNRHGGLTDLLDPERDSRVQPVRLSDNQNLRFLAAGAPTDDSAGLLRSRLDTVLDRVPDDVAVVIDSPPVLALTDAEVIANSVDGIIVVVRAGKTTRSDLTLTMRRLEAVTADVVGVVLVGADVAEGGYHSYYYRQTPTADGPQPTPAGPTDRSSRPTPRRRLRAVEATQEAG